MVVRGLPRLAAGVDLALVVRPGRLERLPTTPPVHQAVGSPRFKAKRGHGVRVREIRQNQKNVCINIINWTIELSKKKGKGAYSSS